MAVQESKKRKRVSNAPSKPSKKVAIAAAATRSVKVTFAEEAGLHPVLLSSPGLRTPSIPFNAYLKPLPSAPNPNGEPNLSTHDLLLHSSQHPTLDYMARRSDVDTHLSHYVAVYDPNANTLHVTPAHHLSLRTTLRSVEHDVEHDKQPRTYAQQREQLGLEFGTKKAKKAIASKTVNAITPRKDAGRNGRTDEVQQAVLDGMSAAKIPERKEVEDELLASKPIPQPNLHAEAVDEVYPLATLIPTADMRIVPAKDWQDAIEAEEDIALSYAFPAFRLRNLRDQPEPDVVQLKTLRYLLLLLEFHGALQPAGRGGSKKVPRKEVLQTKLPGWSDALIDSVRRRFTDGGAELSKWHVDNLVTHIAALSLRVDGWTTLITDLRDDLRFENKQMVQYFLELGCKVAAPTESEMRRFGLDKPQGASSRVARLKLPLEFPKVGRGRRAPGR